jgi:DNA helicase II / ATP-dependent DNA helicase PcrA
MKFLADLHLHSKFSRATSRDMTLDNLAAWAKVKGLGLLATADFTHPEWFSLLRRKLEPAGNGFLRLKKITPPDHEILRGFSLAANDVHFVLSTEISFIYSKKGKVRRIHLLLLAPDLESAEKINVRLGRLGNLRSDGRPILGMDVKAFVRLVMDISPRCVVIPAHIWTPWFSLFGANSGFDSVEECFEELTPQIFALETGLSSDPGMNRRLSPLDPYALISNSDAHSPSKLGREANAFDTEFSFRGLIEAIRDKDPARFLYTVEFFPEEGKYHYDGHRKCGIAYAPRESQSHDGICPVCRKPMTIGVLHRVETLADRPENPAGALRIPGKNLVPLNEIIGQACGKSPDGAGVREIYFRFIHEFGNEHGVLAETPVEELIRLQPERVGRGIERMRRGQVRTVPGHDGEYGMIRLFEDEDGGGPPSAGRRSQFRAR